MIEMPRRSVTRFFIPLIDVLTLLFCIFLLMPLVKATEEPSEAETRGPKSTKIPTDPRLLKRDYDELVRLREAGQSVEQLQKRRDELEDEIRKLREHRIDDLQKKLAIRILEIGEEGRLFYYDPNREKDRRVEITPENVRGFIAAQKRGSGGRDLFFLLMYPRPLAGDPAYPLLSQREQYDRWFAEVAHGYDVR
jgi:hypothetical protein